MAGASSEGVNALLQARELEADCYATAKLARSHRAAVGAAYRFFRLMGSVRLDSEHPDGTARADNIRNCGTFHLTSLLTSHREALPRWNVHQGITASQLIALVLKEGG